MAFIVELARGAALFSFDKPTSHRLKGLLALFEQPQFSPHHFNGQRTTGAGRPYRRYTISPSRIVITGSMALISSIGQVK